MLGYEKDTDLTSIRLVASDMDFTLLADDKSMPDGMDERIVAMEEAGVTFAAASGRPLYTLRDLFPVSHERMALVSDNGAAVVCRGEVVFKSLIEPADLDALLAFTLEKTDGVPIICGLDAGYVPEYARCYDEVFREFYHEIVYVDTLENLGREANKYTVYFPAGNAVAMRDEVFAPAFGDHLSVTCGGSVWIDIMNKGVDKGTGLARLCAHLGVAQADAAAFGDTDNDVEMLEWAGHSYLMANAEERMEPHARFRAPSCNDRGVAVVIDRILEAKRA